MSGRSALGRTGRIITVLGLLSAGAAVGVSKLLGPEVDSAGEDLELSDWE